MEEIKDTAAVATERPRLTREEQEVIITTSAADELAEVYTADPIYMRRLDKRVEQDPGNYKVKNRNTYSATYTMPKRLLQFRLPTAPRELTEEQRAELRERMKKAQAARQNKVSINSQPNS